MSATTIGTAAPPSPAAYATLGRRGPPTLSAETLAGKASGQGLAKGQPVSRLSQDEMDAAAERAKVWDERRKIATYRTAVANGTATPAVHAYVARLEAAEGLLKRTV